MAGTTAGGKKSAETIRKRHGKDFYKRMAEESWTAKVRATRGPMGFAVRPELASLAGSKGGYKGRRKKDV